MIDYRCLLSSCWVLDGASRSNISQLILKAVARLLLLRATNPFDSLDDEADLLLVSSHKRPDLLNDLDAWCAGTEKTIHRVSISANQRIGLYLPGPGEWSRARDMVRQAERHLGFELDALGRLFLSLRALEAHKYFRQLRQSGVRETAVVFSHMEMQFYENILLQVAKLEGCRTYAMQHGFYSDDGPKISATTVNPVNYLANVAHTFLAWGSETVRQVSPYVGCEFLIVGKPASIVVEPAADPGSGSSAGGDSVLVLLDSKVNQSLNRVLLEKVLREAGADQTVYVITHPDDDTDYPGEYRLVCHEDVVPETVIGLNSSALIQYGVAGYRVICHSGSRLLNGANAPVSSANSYDNLVLVEDIPQVYWEKFIQYTAAQSIHKLDALVA